MLGADEVRDLSMWATDGLLPDLTILLDVPVAAGAERVGHEQDRIEAAGDTFHDAVRREFLALAAAQPGRWAVIDGTASIIEVADRVRTEVSARLTGESP